ncbi:MAG: ADP-ribosylglycohydrolase family protein [Promethearchaeota archaeon]
MLNDVIFLARNGKDKNFIKEEITKRFNYDLEKSIDEIRPFYEWNSSCMDTVPPAIRAFLDSSDFEDAIRLAISLGEDSDTLACITGGIAQTFYKTIPDFIKQKVFKRLDGFLLKKVNEFCERYNCS